MKLTIAILALRIAAHLMDVTICLGKETSK